MTLVSFTDCCLQLGIDPKTLRLWLKTAQICCCLHPADARLKCLTGDQLDQLARLHDRRLPARLDPTPPLPPTPEPSPPVPSPEAPSLRQELTLLQAQVATLQAQVTELALALLPARGELARPLDPAAALTSVPSPPPDSPPTPCTTSAAPRPPRPARKPSSPQPPRSRSRALPLIEVRPDGTTVVISPTEGVLPLVPESQEWFDWLSSLTAFSFQGQHGRFSADRRSRNGQYIPCWGARRSHQGRTCHLYIGATARVTLARLEDIASLMAKRLALS